MSYCVFFDFDEIIIREKSMLAVLEEYYPQNSIIKLWENMRFRSLIKQLDNFLQKNSDRKN